MQQSRGAPTVSLGGTVVPYKEVTLAAQLPGRVKSHEDKRRHNLYHRLGKQDFESPSLYHMVLNMNRVSRPQAFEMINHLLKPWDHSKTGNKMR